MQTNFISQQATTNNSFLVINLNQLMNSPLSHSYISCRATVWKPEHNFDQQESQQAGTSILTYRLQGTFNKFDDYHYHHKLKSTLERKMVSGITRAENHSMLSILLHLSCTFIFYIHTTPGSSQLSCSCTMCSEFVNKEFYTIEMPFLIDAKYVKLIL